MHELCEVNRFKEIKIDEGIPILTGLPLSLHSQTTWTKDLELLINFIFYCEALKKKHCNRVPELMEQYDRYHGKMKALMRNLKLSPNIFKADLHYKIDGLVANVLITESGDETGFEISQSKSLRVKVSII